MKEKFNEYQKMFSVESMLWWYRILHWLIYKNISKNFNDSGISILDAGCGTGGLIKYLKKRGYDNISGFDISKHAIEFCRQSDLEVTELDLASFTDNALMKKFDVIISNDTLCYFSDSGQQKMVLSNFYNNLNENGIVIMNLPAMDQFEGIHDIAVGLKMRFTVKRFKDLVDPELFTIKNMRFWPFLLSPLIYVVRKRQMKKIKKGNYEVKSDIDVPFYPVNYLLYLLTRLELVIFSRYPVGSSLLVVLKKN